MVERFDIAEVHYFVARYWHVDGNTWRLDFIRLNRTGFKPRPLLDTATLSENGRFVCARLINQERTWI